jgi:fumarate reductase subunit D
MANEKKRSPEEIPYIVRPEFGTALTILAGLSFLLLGMLLPLVGKAGAKTVHYATNFYVFLFILLVTSALSGLAIKAKLERRKIDCSPLPKFSILIFGLCVLLLVALLFGLLKI